MSNIIKFQLQNHFFIPNLVRVLTNLRYKTYQMAAHLHMLTCAFVARQCLKYKKPNVLAFILCPIFFNNI